MLHVLAFGAVLAAMLRAVYRRGHCAGVNDGIDRTLAVFSQFRPDALLDIAFQIGRQRRVKPAGK